MRILAFSALALGFGLVGFQLSACSNSSEDCNATATCVTSAGNSSAAGSAGKTGASGSGNDAGANPGGAPSIGGSSNTSGSSGVSGTSGTMGVGGEGGAGGGACTGDVSDDAACWTTNELGVFVSSESGDDAAGDGTKEAPFKTISKGVTSAGGKNVYVCVGAGDYSEKISIDAATDGVRIYGGFECSNWTYATTRSAQVVSPSNIALRIDALKKGAYIENVRFQAADGAGLDASSYGAFVTNSKSVVLKRVELKAGKGKAGLVSQTASSDGSNGGVAGAAPAGTPFSCDAVPNPTPKGGTWAIETSCHSQGGPGGTASKSSGNAPSGTSGIPTVHVSPLNQINNGGPGETDNGKGSDGLPGTVGDAGALGDAAKAVGAFAVAGFSLANGNPGGDGYPGQGGGGGGASKGDGASCFGASGGAGGMGGCGGGGGKAGEGGGASIGLFSWSSAIELDACSVSSGTGGAGGAGGKAGGGGAGGDGGSGGLGSQANGIHVPGKGGLGGSGGNGGSGSGGTGGPSYGIVFSGTKPSYLPADTTVTAGTGGAAGVGGKVLTAKAPDGAIGASAAELEVN
jgi:hypothetical protein